MILDKVAPVKEIRLKQRTEPWMNSDILHDIRERDQLLYKFNKDRSKKDLYVAYKKLRNKIQRDIKKAVKKSKQFKIGTILEEFKGLKHSGGLRNNGK